MRRWFSCLAALMIAMHVIAAKPVQAQAPDPGDGPLQVVDEALCSGRLINPITDVCWDCLFPISVGAFPVAPSARPDHPNPTSPICTCPAPPPIFLRIGLSIGWWEPSRLADVTMQPYCFPNLGGLQMGQLLARGRGRSEKGPGVAQEGVWQAHWYIYPLFEMLELMTDAACLRTPQWDIAWLSELDPFWQDDELSIIMNPEAAAFANPVALLACAGDCVAASAGPPADPLFWCSGCQGGIYPLTQNIDVQTGQPMGAVLAANRLLYSNIRRGVTLRAAGPDAGVLCADQYTPFWIKSQWRVQTTVPVPVTAGSYRACIPIGRSTMVWQSLKWGPVVGEDFGFLYWAKRNCCVG